MYIEMSCSKCGAKTHVHELSTKIFCPNKECNYEKEIEPDTKKINHLKTRDLDAKG